MPKDLQWATRTDDRWTVELAIPRSDIDVRLEPDATDDLHIILEVTDTGQPPLTSYHRVIIAVN